LADDVVISCCKNSWTTEITTLPLVARDDVLTVGQVSPRPAENRQESGTPALQFVAAAAYLLGELGIIHSGHLRVQMPAAVAVLLAQLKQHFGSLGVLAL